MEHRVEIKRISQNEYMVHENKVLVHEGNIVDVISIGEQTNEIAQAHLQLVEQLCNTYQGKFFFLIDLNHCGKNSPEARQIWKQLTEMERIEKVGVFGLHPVAKVLASFVMVVTNSNNIRFFNTREEALRWFGK